MTSGQAHVPSGWSREAMTSAPYQLPTYEAAPANNYPAIPNIAAPVQYNQVAYGNHAPLVPYPNQNLSPTPAPNVLAQPEQNNKNIFKKIMIGSAVIAAASVAAGAISIGVYLNRDSKIDSTPNDGADRNASAPAVAGPEANGTLTLDQATPTEFFDDANFTDEQRVDWAYDKLNTPSSDPEYAGKTILEVAHAKLAEKLNNKPEFNNYTYVGELVEPSEDMSGDQILTYESSVEFAAATSELSDQDRTKILAAALDNSHPNLQNAISAALSREADSMGGTSRVDISAVNNQKVESPVFRHTVLNNGYDPEGIPSKVMNTTDTSSGEMKGSQIIVRFINHKPIIKDVYSSADVGRRASNPQNIPAY